MKFLLFLIALTVLMFGIPASSSANVDLLKYYREVNPALKADCTYCHLDKLPKKEDGKHELNAYGSELKKLLDGKKASELSKDELKTLSIELIKQLGRHDEFKATEAPAAPEAGQ